MAKRKQATATSGRRAGKTAEARTSPIRAWQDAVDRGRDWLSARHDYYGCLARRDSARGAPELARHLRGDLLAKQGRHGGWGDDDLLLSAESLWRLLELGMPPESPAVGRALDWLYGRRDQDGAYGSGCTPARHEQRICEHYISGFFSPGPADEPQEVTLANGQTVTSDAGARLLASERALRSVLRARPGDPRASSSVSGLRSLPLYLGYGGAFTPAVLVGAIQALAWVGRGGGAGGGGGLSELSAGLEVLAAEQGKDGTWPNVEFFFVLEALLEVRHPLASVMLGKAVPRLLETQHKHGGWGRRHAAAQTWIALQVLERVGPPSVRGAGG